MFAAAAATALVATLAKGVSAVPCSITCHYELTAKMSWTPERFPTDFPFKGANNPEAHFPEFWTVAHDSSFSLWSEGGISNPGIKEIAELGSGMAFMSEVEACGDSCAMGEGFMCQPKKGDCMMAGHVEVTEDLPYISTASMLAPSPDWFVGIDSFNACVGGEWMEKFEKELFPYDAGTDSGMTFLSPDEVTKPFEPISEFGPDDMGIFYNPTEDQTPSIGMMYLSLACDDMPDMIDDGSYGEVGAYGK